MKKLKLLLASVFAIMSIFSFAGCDVLGDLFGDNDDVVGTYKFNAFVSMRQTLDTTSDDFKVIYIEDERFEIGDMYQIKFAEVQCYANMVVLDLKKDNTFLLVEPCTILGVGEYGKWEKDGEQITLKGKGKDYILTQKDDILALKWGNEAYGSFTNIELKKTEIIEKEELKEVAALYKFSLMTQSLGEESITVNVGEIVEGKKFGEEFFVVDLKANGEFFVLADAMFGLRDGAVGTWTKDGEQILLDLGVGEEYIIRFNLSGDAMSFSFTDEGIFVSLTLKK